MALKEKSRLVFDYLKAHQNEEVSVDSMAEELEIPVKSLNGTLLALGNHYSAELDADGKKIKRSLIERYTNDATKVNDKGKELPVRFIKLSAYGMAFDPDSEN